MLVSCAGPAWFPFLPGIFPHDKACKRSSLFGFLIALQVWMLQSYCNRGTLIDGIERGLLREADGSPKADAILATGKQFFGGCWRPRVPSCLLTGGHTWLG